MWTLDSFKKKGNAATQNAFAAYIDRPLKKNIPATRCWKDAIRKTLQSAAKTTPPQKADSERLVGLLSRIARDSASGKSPPCGIGSKQTPVVVLEVDSREKELINILGPLPFVQVATLSLGDIKLRDSCETERQVLIERKREDDAVQNLKKLEQQRARLAEWASQNPVQRKALFIHESPSWATEAFLPGKQKDLPPFCKFQRGPVYTRNRQSLTPQDLALSVQTSTVLTYGLPWLTSAHTWHTAAILLDLYRCWAKNQAPKNTLQTISAEKCAQVRASSSSNNPTLQFYMLCLGPQKGSAVFTRWPSLRELTCDLQENPHSTERRLGNLRYGKEERRVGPKNAQNLVETLGFESKNANPTKRRKLL